jgi:hypothetical protein
MTNSRAPYVAAGAGAVVALLVFGLVMNTLDAAARADLMFELAKSAIGVLPLAFFGVIVADMIRRRDANLAHLREVDAYRREFRHDVLEAYADLKASRRTLRSAGFAEPWSTPLNDRLLQILDEQMERISSTQLTLERLKREAKGSNALFTFEAEIAGELETLETYLNGIVKEWQRGRAGLAIAGTSQQLQAWPEYAAFIDYDDSFGIAVKALHMIDDALMADLRRSQTLP